MRCRRAQDNLCTVVGGIEEQLPKWSLKCHQLCVRDDSFSIDFKCGRKFVTPKDSDKWWDIGGTILSIQDIRELHKTQWESFKTLIVSKCHCCTKYLSDMLPFGLSTVSLLFVKALRVAICHNVLMSFMSHIVTCFTTRRCYYVDE